MRWRRACAAGLGLLSTVGCSNTALERLLPDRPPETRVTSGPPDSTSAWSYRVHFQWMGTDPDDAVDHFEFILVDHPAAADSIQAGALHRVAVTVPAADDPRWRRTTRLDSTFVVRADTLRLDPRGGDPDLVRRQYFERWHTFFVRAVDSRGLADASPDYRSFNARTLAPVVALGAPANANHFLSCPPNVAFHWRGEDPIDEANSQEPDSSRWVLLSSSYNFVGDRLGFASFPDSLYRLPARFHWSSWRSWNAPDGSGTRAEAHDLLRREGLHIGYYIFAVQAKDEAGAVTPVFDWQTPGKNNVVLLEVSGVGAPLVVLREPSLGTSLFYASSRPAPQVAAAGQVLRFRWSGDASAYGGTVEAYRYGWDVADSVSDASWDQPWSPNVRASVPRSFEGATHRFSLEVRDDLGQITRADVDVDVRPMTLARDLLFVDDSPQSDPAVEQFEKSRWIAVVDSLRLYTPFAFDPVRDVYDVVGEHRYEPPPPEFLFDYKAIVWTLYPARGLSALRQLASFYDPFAQALFASHLPPTPLNAYLDNGGKLWVAGLWPASQVWPAGCIGEVPCKRRLPANVTNWDDPVFSHPQEDSVGVASWLYRMGVETFDVGSGLATRTRQDSRQNCRGLRAAVSGAPALAVDPARWDQLAGPGLGRPNVEIFDMPSFMASRMPSLAPPAGISMVPYVYAGDPEDPGRAYVYPLTADGQPVFVLSKRTPQDARWSRAICSFEPYMLTLSSHVALARYVLLEQMGLGRAAVP